MLQIESLDSEEYFRDPDQSREPEIKIGGVVYGGSGDADNPEESSDSDHNKNLQNIHGVNNFEGGLDENSDQELAIWSKFQRNSGAGANIVTKLGQGVRDPNRVNVFINGRFDFSLDVAQVVDFQLKVGQRLNSARLQELRQASEFGKLYQRALEWVLTRPHSMREARDYLKRRKMKRVQLNRVRERDEKRPLPEFDDKTLSLVFERLVERGYLDDRKFAEYYIENRFVKKGASQKRLRSELMKKGVSSDIIADVLDEGRRDEQEELQKAIAKKRSRYDDAKLLAYLVRQGFDYQMAKSAIAETSDEDTEF